MTTVENQVVITALADAVLDILEETRGLDSVRLFIRGGTPAPVPQDFHPYCEVIIGEENPDTDLSGNVYEQTYTGLLTFTCQTVGAGDWLEKISDRRSSIRSYDVIAALITETVIELQRDTHYSLGDLTITYEADSGAALSEVVKRFYLTGPRVFGLDDRNNTYENFGSVAFTIETERTITA